MTGAVLAACVFFTFITVSVAAFLSVLAGMVFYRYLKMIEDQLAQVPKLIAARVNEGVAEFVQPYKEAAKEKQANQDAGQESFAENEDELEEWMYR